MSTPQEAIFAARDYYDNTQSDLKKLQGDEVAWREIERVAKGEKPKVEKKQSHGHGGDYDDLY